MDGVEEKDKGVFKLIKNSPAGKFIEYLGWVIERLDKLEATARSQKAAEEIESLIGVHLRYLYKNRDIIVQVLLIPQGVPLPMSFREAHKDLDALIKEDAFETSKYSYYNKRRPIDMFYRTLGECYQVALRVNKLYNDVFQSDKFSGLVLSRLRYVKVQEDKIRELWEMLEDPAS